MDEFDRSGAPKITVLAIHPVCHGYYPHYFGFRNENAFKTHVRLTVVKPEAYCAGRGHAGLLKIVETTRHTVVKSDGRIIAADVVAALRVRDGPLDEDAA